MDERLDFSMSHSFDISFLCLKIISFSHFRWELADTEQLPDFMKMCLRVLFDITNDFAEKVYKRHGLNPIDTLKRSVIINLLYFNLADFILHVTSSFFLLKVAVNVKMKYLYV